MRWRLYCRADVTKQFSQETNYYGKLDVVRRGGHPRRRGSALGYAWASSRRAHGRNGGSARRIRGERSVLDTASSRWFESDGTRARCHDFGLARRALRATLL